MIAAVENKTADRFEQMADRLSKQIEHLRRPMTQNPTPKRMREYHGRLHDAGNLERTQRALRALAARHRAGDVPEVLVVLKTKDDVGRLVRKSLVSNSYYNVSTDPEYADKSPAGRALQQLLEDDRTPEEQARDADRAAAEKVKRMEDDLRFTDIPGFFPTPPAVIERMLEAAEIEPGHLVLEPSAGKGDLADAAAAIVGQGLFSRKDSKADGFRVWLRDNKGRRKELPNGAFNGQDAFRRTGVSAVLVIVDKPARERADGRADDTGGANRADVPNNAPPRPAIATDTGGRGNGRAGGRAGKRAGNGRTGGRAGKRAGGDGRSKPDKAAPKAAAGGGNKTDPTPPDVPHEPLMQSQGPANPQGGNLVSRHRPATLAGIVGQSGIVAALRSFTRKPCPAAFVFAGESGIGKTAAAWALANELGCDPDWGGVVEIPAGKQDGRAVDELFRSLHLRPLGGSGWKVAIINEADRMTDQAEAIWLDALERIPAKTVIVFTTNNPRRLSDRFRRRCEVHHFDSTSTAFQKALGDLVRRVWKEETGGDLAELPEGLGQFELADEHYSIGLALQQIAPYARTGDPLPAAFGVPFIRGESPEPAPTPAREVSVVGDTKSAAPTRFYCPACGKWGRKGEPVVSAGNGKWKHVGCK